MKLGVSRVLPALALVIPLVACGPLPPLHPLAPPAARPDSAAVAARARPASSPRPARALGPSASDLRPSDDAIEVLRTIPEPLASVERVAPPPILPPPVVLPPVSSPPSASPAASGGGARDTLGAPADTSRREEGEVPVPEPTYALGQNPPRAPEDSTVTALPIPGDTLVAAGGRSVSADSTRESAPPKAPKPATAPAPAPAPGSGPKSANAPADTCWRVQVAAPDEREKADRIRDGAQSVLLIPMVVEVERRLYKVRTRDCMSREAADRLRSRALGSGFDGAFRFSAPPARKEAR